MSHKRSRKKAKKPTPSAPDRIVAASRPAARLSLRKKVVFALATTAAFFICLEIVLKFCGVQTALTGEDPFVGFESRVPLFTSATLPDGTTMMGTASNKLTAFNAQKFPKRKPSYTFRIFCLGGSTVYGRPYDDRTSFCGWLRKLLPEADPSRSWEVINVGGISYASYRVAVVEEELLQYDPDLFVIYTGHNEFLERRTYENIRDTSPIVRKVAWLAGHTRTFSLLKQVRDRSSRSTSSPKNSRALLPAEVDEILNHSVGPSSYTRDDRLHEQVLEHYRFNRVE